VSEKAETIETGKVKFFDTRPDKRYGFILVDGGTEQLFFHYNDGQFLIAGKTQPKFSDKATVVSQGKTYRMGDPKQDDLIVFERADGLKGDKACPWDFKSRYDKFVEIIANRLAPVTYRVLATMNNVGEPESEGKVEWEGDDLEQLRRQYPRVSHKDDKFLSFWADGDGIFETHHHWQKKNAAGIWESCADPR